MNPAEILESIYSQAIKRSGLSSLPDRLSKCMDVLIDKIDKQKSQVSALVTSCLQKVCHPEQDVRLHRVDFKGGYSARTLDTKITTPFFKKYTHDG